jgi:glutamate synthase (NADPH/NADH) small chain
LYKLVDDYTQKEIEFVLEIGGIEIKYGQALGRDVSLEQLRDQHDAVFIAIGMSDVNALNIPGEELLGVEDAVSYIRDLRQESNLANLPVGRRVIVIGAGMTAIDIAVQSKKLGAEQVSIVYRRAQSAMGASVHEQELALKNGVNFICNSQPKQILGDEAGITAMEFNRTTHNDEGKLITTDDIISLQCDVVFKAIGQKFESSPLGKGEKPKLDSRGRLDVNEQYKTSLNDVFAGGDCIDGKDLVVESVDHGNKAALAIHQQLSATTQHSSNNNQL